ncbi:MAG: penicillin-binding protein 2 [Phycisphaerae bacterium]|nr:penicillin-binding protein 2 [Phycisphaerae bacterium]
MRLRSSYVAGQLLLVLIITALVALFGRLVSINVREAPRLRALAAEQQRSDIPLPARRGLIVDARGRILAGTSLQHSVFADPKLIPDKQDAASRVAKILGLPALELGQDLVAAGQRRFFVIQRGVNAAQIEAIRASRISGIGTFEEPVRTYPLGGLAAQIVGFVSRDGRGIAGLEHQCDEWLGGEPGMKTIIRDAARRAFWLARDGYDPPRDGCHIVLTLDAVIQSATERALRSAVVSFKAESGVAVVLDPRTGAVLAMANEPGFDPNHFQDYAAGSHWRFRNRIITDPVEPGSTFKPFIASYALAEKVVRLGEVFDCEGGLWRDGKRLLHDHHPYSALTFEEVLIKSSNIGMAKIGKRLGNQRLAAALRTFGFGEKTGIDLDGDNPGIVPGTHAWTSFTTTSIPMGQEIAVTPLQLARAFCSFANGGLLVQPHLIRAVLAPDGTIVEDFASPPTRRAIPRRAADTMKRNILAAVINSGTGTRAALTRYQVFGKTGTAQIPKPGGGGYIPDAYQSSFIGGAPLEDPRLVVFVSIRKPDRSIGYYGGTVAAPAAREILSEALAYLRVPPERETAPTVTADGGD